MRSGHARAQVFTVPEGAVILLSGMDMGSDAEMMERVVGAISEACGHSQFALLFSETGAGVDAWWGIGADELAQRVVAALQAAQDDDGPALSDWGARTGEHGHTDHCRAQGCGWPIHHEASGWVHSDVGHGAPDHQAVGP